MPRFVSRVSDPQATQRFFGSQFQRRGGTSVGNVLAEAAFLPLTFVVTLGWWVSRKKRPVQGEATAPERTSPPNR